MNKLESNADLFDKPKISQSSTSKISYGAWTKEDNIMASNKRRPASGASRKATKNSSSAKVTLPDINK